MLMLGLLILLGLSACRDSESQRIRQEARDNLPTATPLPEGCLKIEDINDRLHVGGTMLFNSPKSGIEGANQSDRINRPFSIKAMATVNGEIYLITTGTIEGKEAYAGMIFSFTTEKVNLSVFLEPERRVNTNPDMYPTTPEEKLAALIADAPVNKIPAYSFARCDQPLFLDSNGPLVGKGEGENEGMQVVSVLF